MRVFLFDIDGTLVNTGGAGRDALHLALWREFGISAPLHVNLSGRTDRGITREYFAAHGIDHSHDNWERFRNAYLEALSERLPQRQGAVLPGVRELIAALEARPRTALGLLTGNVRDGAQRKLAHYQLARHFAFGGFGDVESERDDVAREALQAAGAYLQQDISGGQVWVIGDTPLDVRCARAIDARVVAVATGAHDVEELTSLGADLVVENLSATAELLAQMIAE